MSVRMDCLGLDTTIKDRKGNAVHLGDRLKFDKDEWGDGFGFEFVLRFINGEFNIGFPISEVSEWCEVVKKWNAA